MTGTLRSSVLLDHDNLEVYSDAVNYDAEEAPTDIGVAFYCALAQEAGGSVLEVACGTGRVTIPIAKLVAHHTDFDGWLSWCYRKADSTRRKRWSRNISSI
jgi:SAM-dependent methyltransferase